MVKLRKHTAHATRRQWHACAFCTFSQCHQQSRSTGVADGARHEAKLFQTLATTSLRQCRGSDVTNRASRDGQARTVAIIHKSGHRMSNFSDLVSGVSVADHNGGSSGCCRRVLQMIRKRRKWNSLRMTKKLLYTTVKAFVYSLRVHEIYLPV